MQLAKHRAYSIEDFRSADRIDRLHMYLLYPDQFQLNKTDSEYLDLLRRVYAIIADELSDHNAFALIKSANPDLSDYRLHKALRDVKRLWGDIVYRNKQFDRQVLRERLATLVDKASEAQDLTEERRAIQAIIRLDGLDQHDTQSIDPDDIELPDITFTDEPGAFYEDAEVVADEEE